MLADSPVNHVSVFGLANIPLLTLLGALLTDTIPADVYQLRREPPTWRWEDDCPDDFEFLLNQPADKSGVPALVFSLSARIGAERVTAVLRDKVALWELTIAEPHNDFLRSRLHLAEHPLPTDLFVAQLADSCKAHPTRAKWLFVLAYTIGRTIGDRLALADIDWTRLCFVTLFDIALRMGAPFLDELGIDRRRVTAQPW